MDNGLTPKTTDMKRIVICIFAICILAQASVAAQIPVTCKVVDSNLTRLPFATAYCYGNSTGVAADESGELTIMAQFPTDTLLFSMMGYVSLKRTAEEVMASDRQVVLAPQTFEIEKVVVTPRAPYNSLVNGKNSSVKLTGRAGRILLVKVLSTENAGKTISAIVAQQDNMPTSQHDVRFILRARVYSINDDGLPGRDLLTETVKITPEGRARELRVDISAHEIKMPPSGVFVGFEWLPLEQIEINRRIVIPPVVATTRMVPENLTLFGSLHGEWEYFTMDDAPAIVSKKNCNAKIGVEFAI
jgi:hypothetical protein